jgi:uncharacterized RDD family membrane protein YckC
VTYAGFWRRFAAAFIDGLVIGVVDGVLSVVFNRNAGYVFSFILAGAYFTYFHGSRGQTPGDSALSIRVVPEEGGATIGYSRAAIRWIVSYVSGIVFLLGYLWMLWDAHNQTWHDKAARSFVVPVTYAASSAQSPYNDV